MEENTDKHDGCSNPQCECNSTTKQEENSCCPKCSALAHQQNGPCYGRCACHSKQEDYLEPYYRVDHEHCWEDEDGKPPCGQRIEHLKCCLCEMRNPVVASEITKARIEVLDELRVGFVRQWLNEDRITDVQKFVENENIEIMLGIPEIRARITQQHVPSPNILLI